MSLSLESRQDELDILEASRDALKREMSAAESVREIQVASAELRQVLKQIAEVREAIALEEADAALADEDDPAKIAEALLRELPALARAQPEVAIAVRDELVKLVPFR